MADLPTLVQTERHNVWLLWKSLLHCNIDSGKEFLFSGLLDRSWVEFEEYKEEMFDANPIMQDQFMSLLCAVNTDLSEPL